MPSQLTYTIQLIPAEEGGYVVTVPALPGCMTQGDDYDDAIAMAEDAIRLWLKVKSDEGHDLRSDPDPRTT
jgi:predicted RNase H-like HicB family nuclease